MSFARLVESVDWMLLFNLALVSHCKFRCVLTQKSFEIY